MILSDGTDTREVSIYKFGGDPMAEYLWSTMLNGDPGDEYYGDTDYGWANRYGRRVLSGDSNGFVYVRRFATEREASDSIVNAFADWLDNPDDDY